ncbi:hypothetical protein ADIAL_1266 [Alkalibacterium sp. AK22]|nr:hypothetical protein ADIAL_1266 [Alkalibacterium sp. AK22]
MIDPFVSSFISTFLAVPAIRPHSTSPFYTKNQLSGKVNI